MSGNMEVGPAVPERAQYLVVGGGLEGLSIAWSLALRGATDVMVAASGLLKAANLAVFELGMWQSWTGR